MAGYKTHGGAGEAAPAGPSNLVYTENAPKVSDRPTHGSRLPDPLHLPDRPTHGWRLPDALHATDAYRLTTVGTWPDALHATDRPNHGSRLPSALMVSDRPTHGSRLPTVLHLPDAYAWGSKLNTTLHARTAGKYTLTDLVVGRSGTPNTDQMSDGWADEASTGTNHGNESLLCKKSSTVPGADRRIGHIQLDLTRLSGCSGAAGGASFSFIASTSSILLDTTLTYEVSRQATQWFTESTMTWATGRPISTGNVINDTNISITIGAAATYTINLTQTQLNNCIGQWVLFTFQHAGSEVAPETVTILSRDNATASNRPRFTASVTIP